MYSARDWVRENNDGGASCSNNQASCQILNGCGPDIPPGFYPDLTQKNAYCKCTGTTSSANYQVCNPGTFHEPFLGDGVYLTGTTDDGVTPLGSGGLYGTNRVDCVFDYERTTAGMNRPPYI